MTALDDDTYLDEEAKPAREARIRYSPTRVRGEDAYRRAARKPAFLGA